jgi:hypothetical protein
MDRPDYENAPDTTNLHLKAEEPKTRHFFKSVQGLCLTVMELKAKP